MPTTVTDQMVDAIAPTIHKLLVRGMEGVETLIPPRSRELWENQKVDFANLPDEGMRDISRELARELLPVFGSALGLPMPMLKPDGTRL